MADSVTPVSQIKGVGLSKSTEDSVSSISKVIRIAANVSASTDDSDVPIDGIGNIALEKSESSTDVGTPVDYVAGIALIKDESAGNSGTPVEQVSGIALEKIEDGIDWSVPPILIDNGVDVSWYYAPSRLIDYGLTHCFAECELDDLCYCPGGTKINYLSCTYPIVLAGTWDEDVKVVSIDMDGDVSLEASSEASGTYGFFYKLWLNPPAEEGKKRLITGMLTNSIVEAEDCCIEWFSEPFNNLTDNGWGDISANGGTAQIIEGRLKLTGTEISDQAGVQRTEARAWPADFSFAFLMTFTSESYYFNLEIWTGTYVAVVQWIAPSTVRIRDSNYNWATYDVGNYSGVEHTWKFEITSQMATLYIDGNLVFENVLLFASAANPGVMTMYTTHIATAYIDNIIICRDI